MNAAAWTFTILFLCVTAVLCARYYSFSRLRNSKLALTESKEYRALADEYRRLSDMAITTNEHIELKLTDLSVRVDEVRDQLDQVRRILKDVE